jgi:thioredoxin-related protein
MLTAIRTVFLALPLALAAHASPGGGEHWVADFDAAVTTARTENKDLLVDFTGSDWCHWCIKLKSEVFDHDEFTQGVTKDYVLVSLDYPRSPDAQAKVPNKKRNDELQQKYKISGYPTVLLMTVDGEVYAQTGYRPGGPAKYVEHLRQLRTTARNAVAVLNEYEKAAPENKDAAWEKVVAVLEAAEEPSPALQRLIPVVRGALASDADNKKGHKRRAIGALLNVGESGKELLDGARELDPKNEHGLLERALLADYKTAASEESARAALEGVERALAGGATLKNNKIAFELYALSAMVSAQVLSDTAKAKGYAEKAIAIGSDNRQLMAIVEQLAKS